MQGWPLRARRAASAQSRGAISEAEWREVDGKIHATTIMPGAIDTELKTGASDAASGKFSTIFVADDRADFDRPRDCVRHRTAGGCGCEPDRDPADRAGVLREFLCCRPRLAVEGRIERVLMTHGRLARSLSRLLKFDDCARKDCHGSSNQCLERAWKIGSEPSGAFAQRANSGTAIVAPTRAEPRSPVGRGLRPALGRH